MRCIIYGLRHDAIVIDCNALRFGTRWSEVFAITTMGSSKVNGKIFISAYVAIRSLFNPRSSSSSRFRSPPPSSDPSKLEILVGRGSASLFPFNFDESIYPSPLSRASNSPVIVIVIRKRMEICSREQQNEPRPLVSRNKSMRKRGKSALVRKGGAEDSTRFGGVIKI